MGGTQEALDRPDEMPNTPEFIAGKPGPGRLLLHRDLQYFKVIQTRSNVKLQVYEVDPSYQISTVSISARLMAQIPQMMSRSGETNRVRIESAAPV